jgi:flagellar biosynthetic protein FlhB
MAEGEQDQESKTEEPSHKKLEDARKKGETVSTRELNHLFMLLALIFFLTSMAPSLSHNTVDMLSPFITRPESYPMDAASVSNMLRGVVNESALILSLALLLTVIAAIAPAILQGKWVFAAEQIKPKLSKLSPLAGFKRIFGKKALVEFLKNFIKISIVGVICAMVIRPYLIHMPTLAGTDGLGAIHYSIDMITRMLIGITMLLFLLSIIDYLYQRFSFMKRMRMTTQEVKDEYKQQEGDPHHKQKLKQMRAERARKRMMANVPKADVIITNPTHYAVALQYDTSKMAVPKVVAKGVDEVAARIREIAQKNRIIIVRNPPLARLLYDTTEIDDEIPAQQYQAVAKIISYVYRLKGKKPQPARPTAYKKPPPKKQ